MTFLVINNSKANVDVPLIKYQNLTSHIIKYSSALGRIKQVLSKTHLHAQKKKLNKCKSSLSTYKYSENNKSCFFPSPIARTKEPLLLIHPYSRLHCISKELEKAMEWFICSWIGIIYTRKSSTLQCLYQDSWSNLFLKHKL